jgi:Escherichia/Staphylococcus phage prohead protease
MVMRPEIERLGVPDTVEVRTEGEKSVIVGYAATFDTESRDLGGFREVVRSGAFDRALSEGNDVLARANHNSDQLLGRTLSGTLRLMADKRGLRYEIDVPNTTAGRDTLEYVRRGDIRESSFAFGVRNTKDQWTAKASDGLPLRELLEVDLVDVSPVVDQAAYPSTQVSARALEQVKALVETSTPPPPPGVPTEINEARLKLS